MGLTGGMKKSTPLQSRDEFETVSGEIHLRKRDIDQDDFDINNVSDTIVHEGAHKFLGAWDYSYVGVQGMVTSGLQARAGVTSRAAGSVPWDQAKAASHDRTHAQLVQAIVVEGLKGVLPEALDRGRPLAATDPPDVKVAKRLWALVATWGSPNQAPPSATLIDATIATLCGGPGLDSAAKKKLKAYQEDKVEYLAGQGKDLGIKGHDVFFALPTGYLMKNADSWTEVALTAGR